MATINDWLSHYLDEWTARTAWEVRSIDSGSSLTIRTDSRWHLNSPSSMTWSLWNQTIVEWELIYDWRNVRWLQITWWSGTAAIWDTVSQGWVSWYFLWFWSSLTSAPSLTIWATWYIKLREVTWWQFSAGALSFSWWWAATAWWPDVAWWIEIVWDASSTITVPRLWKHTIRWDWFYLDNTNGSLWQTIQLPTNGWWAWTYCPWVRVERWAWTNEYEYWPSLTSTTGWTRQHLWAAEWETDVRHNFVKDIWGWQIQFWETSSLSCTYAHIPTQTSTYTGITHSCVYTWANDLVTVTYSTWHLLQTWHVVWIDFTSGWATADGNYTITVLDQYTYTFPLVWSWAGWNLTARPWLSVTFTANTLWLWDTIFCNFTSGSAVNWNYEIYAIISANNYYIKYPSSTSVTWGNVSTYSRYTVTYTWATASDYMNLSAWNRVYLDFTSWSWTDWIYTIIYPSAPAAQASTYTRATNTVTVTFTSHWRKVWDRVYVDFTSWWWTPDGIYTIASVPNANSFTFALTGSWTAWNCTTYTASFDIIANNGSLWDSGNVTVKQTIWNVPSTWCKVKIPNVILRECATWTRASNQVTAAIANRPERATTTAWALDFEYAYTTRYMNLAQPYSVRIKNSSTYDSVAISECATALDIENTHTSMYWNQDVNAIYCVSNFAWWTIKDCKFQRWNTPGSLDHSALFQYCIWITFDNITTGIIQYARSTWYAMSVSNCSDIIIKNCHNINWPMVLTSVFGVTIQDYDHTDRYIWYTNATTPYNAIIVNTWCTDIMIDWLTLWFWWTIVNVHPHTWILSISNNDNLTLRNVWSLANPISTWTFRNNLYWIWVVYTAWWNSTNIRIQRVYFTNLIRTGLYSTGNSDKWVLFESFQWWQLVSSAMAISSMTNAYLEWEMKWVRSWVRSTTWQSSVYWTHYFDFFYGTNQWFLVLAMNEPTVDTEQYFTMVSWTRRFNSAWWILMKTAWDQAIREDNCFRLWHTWFVNTSVVMSWWTIWNYTLEYQIDTGTWYWWTRKTLNWTNLSWESVDPSIWFKIKIRITTLTNNTTAITYIWINTTTSYSAQSNLYPLDYSTVTLTWLTAWSRVQLYDTTNSLELYNWIASWTTLTYSVPYVSDINCRVRIMYQNWLTANIFEEFTETLSINGISRSVSPTVDSIYVANAVDWSAVVGITINDWALLIETEGWTYSRWQIYAYETYWLSTEEGIRDEWRFIRAIDQANYELTDFKIKNVSSPSIPLTITWWYWFDSATWEAIDIIDTSGWTIFTAPDRVVAFQTAWEVVISWDIDDVWTYANRTLTDKSWFEIAWTKTTLDDLNDISTAQVNTEVDTALADYDAPTKAELDSAVAPLSLETTSQEIVANTWIINEWVKKASILVPHTTDI